MAYPRVTIGRVNLSTQQVRIIELVAQGLTNLDIASALSLTEPVVKNYLRNIYDVTGMDNRVQLTLWYLTKTGSLHAPSQANRLDVPSSSDAQSNLRT